jgi:hypothetical protein
MRVKFLCAAILILFGVVGCANQVPVAENFSLSTQKKLRAPHHWDVIANDVVSETRRALFYHEDLKHRPVYIRYLNDNATHFSAAFRNFMITGLVNSGVPVTENPQDAVIITYDTQVVRHTVDRKYSPLLSDVLVSRKLEEKNRSADHGSLSSILTDGPTRTELIVNTSIIEDGNYRMRKSDVYYIDGQDIRLFLPKPKPQEIPVYSPPVQNLKVVGQ